MKRYIFLATDLLVPVNTTYVDVTNFTSLHIDLTKVWSAALTLYAKGTHGSCALAVVYKFATYDSLRAQWDTIEYLSTSLFMYGTAISQKTITFDPCPEKVKLLSVYNPETTSGYTVTVNASLVCHFV